MKKLIMMAALLVSTVAAMAQHEVGSVNIQPKVGLNIANITDGDGNDARIGLVAGGEVEYQLSDIFSLSGGLLYSQQGAKGKEGGADVTLKLDYLNVPILANVYVAKGLAVKLGLQPGFKVNGSATAKAGGMKVSGDLDDFGLDVKGFDLSVPVGLSYEFSNVQLDARYNWGLTKIVDGSDSKNSVFQITVGYKFDL